MLFGRKQFNWLKMLDGMNRPEIYPIGSTPKGRQSKGEAKLEISCQSRKIGIHNPDVTIYDLHR